MAVTRGAFGSRDVWMQESPRTSRLTFDAANDVYTIWSPDGRFILYGSALNNGDLMVVPVTGDRKPFPFLSTTFTEQQGVFSLDALLNWTPEVKK